MQAEVTKGKCNLCSREDEGIQITERIPVIFIKIFLCEGCVSKLFKLFSKNL